VKSEVGSKKLKPESPQLKNPQEGSRRVQAGVTTARSETPTRGALKIRVLAGITTAEKERESANPGDLKEGLKKSGWKFTTERREMEVTKKEGMAGGNTTGKERNERKKERGRGKEETVFGQVKDLL